MGRDTRLLRRFGHQPGLGRVRQHEKPAFLDRLAAGDASPGLSQRMQAFRPVIGRIVDQRAYRHGDHFILRIGPQQTRQQRRILHRRIEPEGIILRPQDHRRRSAEPSLARMVASIPEPYFSSPGERSCSDSDRRQVARRGASGRRRQIQRQNDGSLTVAEFCRRLGVSTVTFYAWKRRFHEAPAASPINPQRPSARPLPEANGAATPAFLPVSILDAGATGHLEIELANACVVRLTGAINPELLRIAIRAVGRLGGEGRGGD